MVSNTKSVPKIEWSCGRLRTPAGEVGDGIGDAGGNADDVVEHDVMVEQRVHDAAGKYRAEGAAL